MDNNTTDKLKEISKIVSDLLKNLGNADDAIGLTSEETAIKEKILESLTSVHDESSGNYVTYFNDEKNKKFYSSHNFKYVRVNYKPNMPQNERLSFIKTDVVEIPRWANMENIAATYYSLDEVATEIARIYTQEPVLRKDESFQARFPIENGSFNGGRKQSYKSTKTKVSVVINKKAFVRTVYKNSKNVSYIKVNNQYKLLSKYMK